MAGVRGGVFLVLLWVAAGSLADGPGPVHAQEQIKPAEPRDAFQFPVDERLVATLRQQLLAPARTTPVLLQDYPMPDGSTTAVTLQTFSLWAPDAVIAFGPEVEAKGQPRGLLQLIGQVSDDPKTIVQLRMSEERPTGLIYRRGSLFPHAFIEIDGTPHVSFRPAGEPAVKGPDQRLAELKAYLETIRTNEERNRRDQLDQFCCIGTPGGTEVQYVDLAVETDDELWRIYGDASYIQAQVENIVAGVNAIYFRDVGTVLFRLRRLAMHTDGELGGPDPFHGMHSGGVVRELRDFWSDPSRAAERQIFDVAVLLSARFMLGGSEVFPPWVCAGGARDGDWCHIGSTAEWASCPGGDCAWAGIRACEPSAAYAVLEFHPVLRRPVGDPYLPDIREALEINVNRTAHELGHMFGAEHTHCIDASGDPPVTYLPIDRCVSGETSLRLNACYVGQTYQAFNGDAYIMSYCAELFPNTHQRTLEFHQANANLIRDGVDASACLTPARVVELQNGVSVTNLSSTQAPTRHYFAIHVPGDVNELTGEVSNLRIETFGGSGVVKLYGRYGSPPGPFGNEVSEDPGTTTQAIDVSFPRAGWWYVLPVGAPSFSGISLRAAYQP